MSENSLCFVYCLLTEIENICNKNPLQSELLVHKYLQSLAQHNVQHCAPHRLSDHSQHSHFEVCGMLK